jgi:hypothetical protein
MNEQVSFPTMSDREKYLFDLQGFLVIKGMLSADEVKALNEALDTNQGKRKDDKNRGAPGPLAGEHVRGLYEGMLTWEKPWCQPLGRRAATSTTRTACCCQRPFLNGSTSENTSTTPPLSRSNTNS